MPKRLCRARSLGLSLFVIVIVILLSSFPDFLEHFVYTDNTPALVLRKAGDGALSQADLPHEPYPQQFKKVLILYAHANGSTIAMENYEYFVGFGLLNSNLADFVFLLSGDDAKDIVSPLLSQYPNAKVIRRANYGFDICAYKEYLQGLDRKDDYSHFIFINSSVRGPFVPLYLRDPWFIAFLIPLHGDIKLSGSYITCELKISVMSMAMATDREGMEILQSVWQCQEEKWTVIYTSELGSSERMLGMGYAIGSLLIAQPYVRKGMPEQCRLSSQWNPVAKQQYFGRYPGAMETMFVKFSGDIRVAGQVDENLIKEVEMLTFLNWRNKQDGISRHWPV
eukprot:CAMPEP_0184339012 /NCGR_PEP_ID=MMETSP1089-20130417/7665_1 /TAXON_ID=38269 ORGANISM="Gloeochaete wittrockiana, Strain SAG46.84" /NCGR_SAMPLE_ID=MMETSP1089 /ASSEMBLY_ACC=CAM_ASM_000445 /LENGTH=337 /DNA_ID=CAMNT_0026665995 /DNA_START=38 /DNA_END=1051 /DNA_ORIENTATION=-